MVWPTKNYIFNNCILNGIVSRISHSFISYILNSHLTLRFNWSATIGREGDLSKVFLDFKLCGLSFNLYQHYIFGEWQGSFCSCKERHMRIISWNPLCFTCTTYLGREGAFVRVCYEPVSLFEGPYWPDSVATELKSRLLFLLAAYLERKKKIRIWLGFVRWMMALLFLYSECEDC